MVDLWINLFTLKLPESFSHSSELRNTFRLSSVSQINNKDEQSKIFAGKWEEI